MGTIFHGFLYTAKIITFTVYDVKGKLIPFKSYNLVYGGIGAIFYLHSL